MKKLLVLLDNGHGNNTPGKCSPDKSIYEWQWCREIVQMLGKELRTAGIDTYTVTPEDNDVSLSSRVRRINAVYDKYKNDYEVVLISVHINAAGDGKKWCTASGWSGWICENASEKSKFLAQCLYREAASLGLKGNRSVPKDYCWRANFYITKNSKCPAVLTENMFQDNKNDVEYLLSNKGKREIVELHKNALIEYINKI